jgi:hypothetical protein
LGIEQIMSRALRFVIFALVVTLAPMARGAEVQLGSMAMQWPDGFTHKAGSAPIRLVGTGGEEVLASIFRIGSEAQPWDKEIDFPKMLESGSQQISTQAQRVGKVVVPLQRKELPDGSTLLTAASETSSLFSKGYFLLYMVISPAGRVGFITVEGSKSVATQEHERFLPYFQSVSWQ